MAVFIPDKDKAKLYLIFQTRITPNLNVSARMSLSISEIVKPFQKTLRRVISGLTTQGKQTPARFFKSS